MQNPPQTPTWYPQCHGMLTSGTLWRLLNGCSYCFHIFWRSNGPRSARWFSFQCGSSCLKVINPLQNRFPIWHMYFDWARSVYGTLSASLSQNGCSHNTLQQLSPDVHRSNPLWVLTTVEANQPHDTTPTTDRTVTLRKVGDVYAPHCMYERLLKNYWSDLQK